MQSLLKKIETRTCRVGIVGLGYVGLPLALSFGRAGFRVLGFDTDAQKIARLTAGESYVGHIPDDELKVLVDGGKLEATVDFARAGEADAILICVPTPLTRHREPDLSFIEATCRQIAPRLRRGQLIVLESTTYPGTTEEVVRPLLEAGGLRAGQDFFLAYSPEREDPGNPKFSLATIPKVVGGCDPDSLKVACALYDQVTPKTYAVSDTRTAEAVKLLENIFRSVNIALVNELKLIFDKMDINVWEVIEAAKTKPFGFMPFYPGPGPGGHCLPIDPFYLAWKARAYGQPTRFIELAGEINTGMPAYIVTRLTEGLNRQGTALNGSAILLLGVAYKKNVDDDRGSPAYQIFDLLLEQGANVDYHDSFVPVIRPSRDHPHLAGRESVSSLDADRLGRYDAVVIVTDHSDVDYELVVRASKLIVDTRNATKDVSQGREKIVRA